jgi:hypothetical protein
MVGPKAYAGPANTHFSPEIREKMRCSNALKSPDSENKRKEKKAILLSWTFANFQLLGAIWRKADHDSAKITRAGSRSGPKVAMTATILRRRAAAREERRRCG